MKTKAAVPTKQIVGLKSFLPNKHKIIPTTMSIAPHNPTYLFRKDQIALIEATEHPLVEFTYILITHGSLLGSIVAFGYAPVAFLSQTISIDKTKYSLPLVGQISPLE